MVKNKFDRPSAVTQRHVNSHSSEATTAADQSISAQQDSSRLLGNHLNQISHVRRATASAFDSASMATINEQEDLEATVLPIYSNLYAKNKAI